MKIENSLFRAAAAPKPRLPLCMPCTLYGAGHPLDAETTNISYCGLGIRLSSVADGQDWSTVDKVVIPDIGLLDIEVRWHQGDQLGLILRNAQATRAMLTAYFEQIGAFPA